MSIKKINKNMCRIIVLIIIIILYALLGYFLFFRNTDSKTSDNDGITYEMWANSPEDGPVNMDDGEEDDEEIKVESFK